MSEETQKQSPQPTCQTEPPFPSTNTQPVSQISSVELKLPKLTYLASPYSHREAKIRAKRFSLALDATASLMKRSSGDMVYSPIVQCHLISLRHSLPTDSVFWEARDKLMISLCDTFAVLLAEGWRDSVGVKSELAFARSLGKPVWMVSPKDLGLEEK